MLALTCLALAFRPKAETALLLGAGAIIPLMANLLLFWLAFGDPLYYFRIAKANLQQNFITQAAPWGTHDALYYLKMFFFDGRQLWLAPFMGVGGIVLIARRRPLRAHRDVVFVTVWFLVLFLFFSFFVYSVSPFRLIPKQPNYAVFFAAPLALLSGFLLSRITFAVAMPVLLVHIGGGWMLAAIEGYGHRLHGMTHRLAIEFARDHPASPVFAGRQTRDFNTVLQLLGEPYAGNLRLLAELEPAGLECGKPSAFAVLHATWPEASRWETRLEGFQPFETIDPTPRHPLGRASLEWVEAVRGTAPSWVSRQLAFAHHILYAGAVKIYPACPEPRPHPSAN